MLHSRPALLALLFSLLPLTLALAQEEATSSLGELLPKTERIVEEDGVFLLQTGIEGKHAEIRGVDEDTGALTVAFEGSELAVAGELATTGDAAALRALPQLVETATKAELDLSEMQLSNDPLVGACLRSDVHCVLPELVLVRTKTSNDTAPTVAALSKAVDALRAEVAANEKLNPQGRKSLERILNLLVAEDPEADPLVTPDYARAAVRHGWLESVHGDTETVKAVVAANAASDRARPEVDLRGGDLELALVRDAFGEEAWILTSPDRAAYSRALPDAQYVAPEYPLTLVVEFPVGTDPMTAAVEDAIGASVHAAGTRLAHWSVDPETRVDTLEVDEEAWRIVHPLYEGLVDNLLPPHVLLVDLEGDVRRLITPFGSVTPVQSGEPAEAERFLSEATAALPDAGYLDLIGQYLFRYTHDSPDPRQPLLIGSEDTLGDIHQTTRQTLATCVGGVCRGDCDDLAEVYHEIANRQGKLCHIMSIPAHNAACWAEEVEVDEDETEWVANVLQTGPPRQFRAPTLPQVLEQAYGHFLGGMAFNPESVGLMLRFAGENQRSSWVLSYRIFAEPEYAKTMIDVQRDWHYGTYQQGIKKMQQLIASGDAGPANFGEMSGLSRTTGQWALAAQYELEAIRRGGDATYEQQVNVIQYLYRAGKEKSAHKKAQRMLDRMGVIEQQLVDAFADVALRASIACLFDGKDYEIGLDIFCDWLLPDWEFYQTRILEWMQSEDFSEGAWEAAPQILRLRFLMRQCVATAVQILNDEDCAAALSDERREDLETLIEGWIEHYAMRDLMERTQILSNYSVVGDYLQAVEGDEALFEALAKAEYPETADIDFTARSEDAEEQRKIDLQWVKASPAFWAGEAMYLVRDDATELDAEKLRDLHAELESAYEATDRLGLQSLSYDNAILGVRMLVALVDEDELELENLLEQVAASGDTDQRNLTRDIYGAAARFLDKAWFAKALDAWHRKIGDKPGYYGIAWECRRMKAPAHALLAAELAAKTFPEEETFQEELAFMQKLLAPELETPEPETPEPETPELETTK